MVVGSPGEGPIYSSELECRGTENSILDCPRSNHLPTGLHLCYHDSDVAIDCVGM